MTKPCPSTFLLCLPLLLVGAAQASVLTGTTVTGSLTGNGGVNVFDPANLMPPTSFVPPGDLNAAGTTVTVQDRAVEFGAESGDPSPGSNFVLLEANFTGTGLFIDYQMHLPAGSSSPPTILVFQFIDAALAGLPVIKATDTFTNGGLSRVLSGDTLTLTWQGEDIVAAADNRSFERQAAFRFVSAASVPEPGTIWLIGCAAAVALARRTRLSRSFLSWSRNR